MASKRGSDTGPGLDGLKAWSLPKEMWIALMAHVGISLQYNITFVLSTFIVRQFLASSGSTDETEVGR